METQVLTMSLGMAWPCYLEAVSSLTHRIVLCCKPRAVVSALLLCTAPVGIALWTGPEEAYVFTWVYESPGQEGC